MLGGDAFGDGLSTGLGIVFEGVGLGYVQSAEGSVALQAMSSQRFIAYVHSTIHVYLFTLSSKTGTETATKENQTVLRRYREVG